MFQRHCIKPFLVGQNFHICCGQGRPPFPPCGQPDHKISGFLTTSLTLIFKWLCQLDKPLVHSIVMNYVSKDFNQLFSFLLREVRWIERGRKLEATVVQFNQKSHVTWIAKIDTWISLSCYMDLSKEVRWVERGWTLEAALVHFQPRKSASSRHLVATLRIPGYKRC